MRTPLLIGLVLTLSATAAPAQPLDQPAEPRPALTALRLGEADLLARFTPEVRDSRKLRERALALWQAHFSTSAAELKRRFVNDDDWRPVLAAAAALIDDYLETSLLPRAGAVPAREGQQGNQGSNVWIETIDPKTEQRIRVLRPAPARPVLIAPERPDDKKTPALDQATKVPLELD